MLCEVCKKKPAAVHMVCMMGDKQVDKWLCRDCAQEYIPAGLGGLPEDIDGMGMSMGMPQKLPDGVAGHKAAAHCPHIPAPAPAH